MYSIFRNLALILISAKFFALLARKCRAPQVVGEIIAGLVIGPCLLNLVQPSDSIAIFAEIGVVLLMFTTGLGTNLQELMRAGPIATLIACVGVAVPLAGDKNVWMGSATGTPRVQNVRIYNKKTGTYEPLDLNRTYALAGMNYTLRNLGDGFAMFDGAELIKDYVSEDYLVMSTYAMIFDAVNDMPVLSSANSPLASYPGYLLNYENPYGAGRIQVV